MLDEYDAMSTALTWDDMLSHCRQITYVQDDFGAIGGAGARIDRAERGFRTASTSPKTVISSSITV